MDLKYIHLDFNFSIDKMEPKPKELLLKINLRKTIKLINGILCEVTFIVLIS